jgi:hypothetical protein
MTAANKNVTFSLPTELMDKLKVYVENDYIPSLAAGVKEALECYTKTIEKEILKKKMLEASKDPLFMRDLNESMSSFDYSDKEISRRLTEW